MTLITIPLARDLVKPRMSGDVRGFFCETYQADQYRAAGINAAFVQDNLSRSGLGLGSVRKLQIC